jgi:hypothetical protein
MPTPLWKGTKELQLDERYPQWDTDTEGRGVTLLYVGPYETCVAEQPNTGSSIEGFPANIFINRVQVHHQPAGAGHLIITARTPSFDPGDPGDNTDPIPIYGVDWVEVNRKLTAHPRYTSGGAKELTIRDHSDIQNWEDEQDAVLRADFKYTNEDKDGNKTEVTLSSNAQDYATKALRGQDSYTIFIPEISRTRYYSSRPATGDAGSIQAPPISIGGSWEYRKTADSMRSSGNGWERSEKWTGLDDWDADLY